MTRSTDSAAQFLLQQLGEFGYVFAGTDLEHRRDRDKLEEMADNLSRFFNQTPLDQALNAIEDPDAIDQAIIDYIRAPGILGTIQQAKDHFDQIYYSAPGGSKEEQDALLALHFLTRLKNRD